AIAAREAAKAEEERRKAEEEQRRAEKKAEEERRRAEEEAEAARIKAEKRAEEERIKAEKLAEKERIRVEEERRRAEEEQHRAEIRAEEERRRAEEEAEAARIKAEKRAEEERRRAEEEQRRAEEEQRRAEKKAEEERIKAEKRAEEERIKADKKAAALAAIAAREAAKKEAAARAESEKQAAAAAALAEKQQRATEKEAERQRIAAEKEAERLEKEQQRQAAAEAAAAKKEAARAEKERIKAEKEAAKLAKKNKKLADELLSPTPVKTDEEDDGKKKNRLLPILLILLLLCIIGGGAYLLLNKGGLPMKTGEVATVNVKHLDVPAENSLTFNTDMLNYTNREVMVNRDQVCDFMRDYINQFLADRNYSNARVPMMDRVRQYAGERLATLMGDRFAVQRLIPYDDYIYQYNVPCLKDSYANRSRVTVQKELMEYRALDDILYQMVDELGLQPDGSGRKTAAEVKEVKQTEKKAIDKQKANAQPSESPVYVYVEKGSKQGYDIIAGFYLNKATAAKMTARLHDLGCDAYIIEFNDLYYVSMGSASSQTAADALLKHIKSWYDGDAVIKRW
ncbi:MAG: SPOR domain-containing protein, partial [Bacteroidales bacterium]|nr:SPOR domain-containing protein [Bacteroidales bacterium]